MGALRNLRQILFRSGPDVEVRFRASHFPFTEPSAEIDFRLLLGQWRYLEDWAREMTGLKSGGSGMVHPKVLKPLAA